MKKMPMITNVFPKKKNDIFPYPGYALPASASQTPKNTKLPFITKVEQKDDTLMTWGQPTWFLLHSIAEKINPERFENKTTRQDVLNVIYTICTNLPCPECSEHAKKYLSQTVGYTNIRTKDELKDMLFHFHNYVNKHKKYEIFTKDELDEKYARANIKNIIYNFLVHYQEGSKNPNMISNELYRSRIISQLIEWFKTNITLFSYDPLSSSP